MADDRYDYYRNSPDPRPGNDQDRDVYLDNRTGASAPGRGYRASSDGERSHGARPQGDRDYFRDHFGPRDEGRSFRPGQDIDRGYRTYPEEQPDRSRDRAREEARWNQERASAFNRAYSADYNPYPTYGYVGYESTRPYANDPRLRGDGGGRDHNRGFWDQTGDTVASWFGDDEARRRHQADMARESHQGRGPKTYKRSDARIQEDVNDRFTDDPWLDATHIDVSVQDTEVTLSGTVGSRDDRRHAERLAEHISGVTHVQNNLRVDAGKDVNRDQAHEPGLAEGVNTTLDRQANGRH